jgi:hypothetical protein
MLPGLPNREAAEPQLWHDLPSMPVQELFTFRAPVQPIIMSVLCLSAFLLSILLFILLMFALQAVPGHIWLILDAGGGTVDIVMHRIEEGSMRGQSQLSEVLRATCLLQGSTRLDQQAEQLLLSLFDGAPWEFERWKQEDPQGYISQVRKVWIF